MKFPNKAYLEQLRKQYPKGTKLQLISMRNEKYPILPGTVGEVTHIDDATFICGGKMVLPLRSFRKWILSEWLGLKIKAEPIPSYCILPYKIK